MTWIFAGTLGCLTVAVIALTEADRKILSWWRAR